MPGERGEAAEAFRGNDDVVVAALARSRMPGMQVAVVADREPGRRQGRLQPLPDERGDLLGHGGVASSSAGSCCSQTVWPTMNTSSAPVMPQTLNFAQTA